ncbi:MAG: hypothetical protein U9N02_08000 [Campylobacterota bacterium]|nr:hypothetical protein [Campylobacterota bacterium]
MKLIIEDFLQNIDESFKDKGQKDIYMTYLMIFGLIFTFSYLLFWDKAEDDYLKINQEIINIKAKLNADKNYLIINPKAKINKLEKDIIVANVQKLVHEENNRYIKTKIETISSLIYDEIAWGKYLHSISKKAKQYNIKIIKITNSYNLNKKAFGHILDITINSSANYKNTLKFINSLEQSNLVVDIHDLNITTQEEIETSLNISVWGIAY